MPVQLSNVQFVLPDRAATASGLGARFLDDGSKERFCKKCGAGAGQIAPAKAAHATGVIANESGPQDGRQEITDSERPRRC